MEVKPVFFLFGSINLLTNQNQIILLSLQLQTPFYFRKTDLMTRRKIENKKNRNSP